MIFFCRRTVWNSSGGYIARNDELGTMALEFSKAGYDVSAICVVQADKNSIRVLQENWGDVVRVTDYMPTRPNWTTFRKQIDYFGVLW